MKAPNKEIILASRAKRSHSKRVAMLQATGQQHPQRDKPKSQR